MKSRRILFITTQDINDIYGVGGVKAAQRNYHLMQQYAGEKNILLCMFVPKNTSLENHEMTFAFKRITSPLGVLIGALCRCKIYYPWQERKIIAFIRNYNPNLLFIDSSMLGRIAKFKNIAEKTIVFYHNIESDYAWNKVKNDGFLFLPAYWASKYNDKCGCCADKIICLNRRDSNRLKELYGRKADFLLPISFADTFDVNRVTDYYNRSILFVGSFFTPNVVSVEWFIKEVMPKLDNISLDIVGKGFEQKKYLYEKNENIRVIGSVKDLDEYYYSHVAVVLPIFCGAGMKVKTAEAMMYGRTIFASDEALEGYDVENVEGIVRCNTAEEYIEAINLFFSKNNFPKYQKEVRDKFLAEYETNVVSKKVNQFLDELF